MGGVEIEKYYKLSKKIGREQNVTERCCQSGSACIFVHIHNLSDSTKKFYKNGEMLGKYSGRYMSVYKPNKRKNSVGRHWQYKWQKMLIFCLYCRATFAAIKMITTGCILITLKSLEFI